MCLSLGSHACAMQGAGGAGLHAANLVLSTTSMAASGSLHDWLTISSSGLHLSSIPTYSMQKGGSYQ